MKNRSRVRYVLLCFMIIAMVASMVGCSGDDGSNGAQGAPGTSTGTVQGTVTVAGTTQPVTGATVTTDPATSTFTTDSSGNYSASLPVGVYALTFKANNFTTQTQTVSVTAGQTVTKDVALVATSNVVVMIRTTGTAVPGATLDATATVITLDGSTVQSEAWSQGNSVTVTFGTPNAETTTVTLPALATYKDELFKVLKVSPLPDTDDPTGSTNEDGTPFEGGLQDRFQVQAINNFELEKTGEVTLQFEVKTSSGTYKGTAAIVTALPYKTSTGLAQVPVNEAVVIHGKDQPKWNYTLLNPSSTNVTNLLDDPTSQNPVFTPPTTPIGHYTLTETNSGAVLDIYVGTWQGALSPGLTLANLNASGQGNPVGDTNCTPCHAIGGGGIAPDMFTPWSKSGHAQIFTQNVNAGGHYSSSCFPCHMVGYDPDANNNGVDEQSGFSDMLNVIFNGNTSPTANPLNWKTILQDYPLVAHMSNIQCENCHGPNNSPSHPAVPLGSQAEIDERNRRVSMDAAVCGDCHGEPARHGRYQEWQISGHANYDTAIGEGFDSAGAVRTSCAGCHTAQGALQWFAQLEAGNPSRTLDANSLANLAEQGFSPDNVQPQACAVCHNPHNPGTVSSLGNDVRPRIVDNTPLLPGGFKAIGVGDGAMCITCHNSRNGEAVAGSGIVALHEDNDPTFGTLTSYSSPHEACQGDVLMGRNAYFVQGERSAHSNIPNTCTACHMELVPAPAELGYPTATNHTFEANLTICSKCHGELDGTALQASVVAELADLKAAVEAAVERVYTPGSTVEYNPGRQPTLSIDGADPVNFNTVVVPATNPINTDIFAKTNWNYELIAQDFSKGVHNPSFVHAVLFNTTQQVNSITTAQ